MTSVQSQPQTAADPAAAFEAGNRALGAGRPAEAAEHYRRALAAAPQVVEIHNNLATAQMHMGRPAEAVVTARLGLAVREDFPHLHNTLANALVQAGEADAAADHYYRALELAPELDSAALNLADLLRERGAFDEAQALLDGIAGRHAGEPDLLHAQAALARARGDIDGAIELLKRALAAAPGHAPAASNLAICLLAQGHHHDALAILRDLALSHPELADVHGNLGQVLQGLGRHDEAVQAFRTALARDPGREDLLPFLLQSLLNQCDWRDLDRLTAKIAGLARRSAGAGESAISPFALAGIEVPPEVRKAVAVGYSARCTAGLAGVRDKLSFRYQNQVRERLRVGFISPDFRQHSVAVSFEPLLRAHDRERFDWHGYWIGREPEDAVTERFRGLCHRFTDLRQADPVSAARAINADGIDVLVDLAGHTRDSALEILSLRPAPVQAHYLGYASTLGSDAVDYLITDPVHTPPSLAPHCVEKQVYLPHSFMAAGRPEIAAVTPSRAECGLPDDGLVLANFNAHYKFDPKTFAVWMRCLAEHPGSVLWLKQGTALATANLRMVAAGHGVAPDRLMFAERAPHAEHLARLRLADLAVDTRLHAGGVTSLDALWAGVPVLTVAGDNHAARTGASMLMAAGLPGLVTGSLEDYAGLLMTLADDEARRAGLRWQLEDALDEAPLFDCGRLARHLEWVYGEMARRWRAGEPPETFKVGERYAD